MTLPSAPPQWRGWGWTAATLAPRVLGCPATPTAQAGRPSDASSREPQPPRPGQAAHSSAAFEWGAGATRALGEPRPSSWVEESSPPPQSGSAASGPGVSEGLQKRGDTVALLAAGSGKRGGKGLTLFSTNSCSGAGPELGQSTERAEPASTTCARIKDRTPRCDLIWKRVFAAVIKRGPSR